MKNLLSAIAFACLSLSALGQNLTTVSAANITDLNGTKLAVGQLCFTATDQSDTPISFQIGGGGQALKRGYCSSVMAGAVTSFTVPNPAATLPTGIYYRVTVKDSSTGQEVLRYPLVSFTGATFNFDNYAPLNLANPAPLTGNTVTGNLAVTGNVAATGTVTGSNIPGSIPGAGACVNQFVRVLTSGLPPTCATVGSADLAASLGLVTPNIGAATGTSLNLSGAITGTSFNFSGNGVVGGTLGVTNVNGFIYVDGTKYVQTDAGITSAIAAAPDGGTVFLGPGTYTMSGSLPIVISKRITIRGAGWGTTGTVLQVGAGVGATTDVFLVKPSASFSGGSMDGVRLQDFHIVAASGTPGRSAIMIDGTNASVSNLVIDHVRCDPLGNYAFNIQNASGLTNGTPFLATIRDSVFDGGMNFTNAGDSILVVNNQIRGTATTSPSSPNNVLISVIGAATTDQGAHGFQLIANNMVQAGGTIWQNATQGVMAYNDVEMPTATTEANSALVDVQGNASANIQNLKIYGNYLGATTGNITDTIRIDRATATEIFNNYTVRSTGKAYRITANAVKTHIVHDRIAPDTTINNFLADLGTNTLVEYQDSATNIKTFAVATNAGVQFSTLSGVVGAIATQTSFQVNPTNGTFGFTSGTPGQTTQDTVAWRGGANQWVFGNSFGDTSGLLLFASQAMVEGGAPAAVAGRAVVWADSTSHRIKNNLNNIGVWTIPGTIDSGTADFTGQSASIATQTSLTGTASTGGHYQFNLSGLCTATDASGATIVFSVTWTSDGVSQTVSTGSLPLTATTNSNVRLTTFMNVDASTNVTWVATVTGAPTTGRFAVHVGLLKL